MSEQTYNDAFLEKVRTTLDTSVENIDVRIQSRLSRIREEALRNKSTRLRQWLYLPVTGIAAALAVLIASVLYFNRPDQVHQIDYFEDVEILASSDSLEFYANLDFYAWLAEEERDAG